MTSNVALAPRPPAASGCFFIPALDPEIPAVCGKGSLRDQTIARFALACEREGIPLPAGDGFQSADQVLSQQWTQFLDARHGASVRGLAGTPRIFVNDEALSFVICAEQQLPVYQLKIVIEKLERAATGLGWFVHSAIRSAAAHGHMLYEVDMMDYLLAGYGCDLEEFTDEAYARLLLDEYGDDELPKGAAVPQETIDKLKEENQYWPSDLLAEAGGHVHLLAIGHCVSPKRKTGGMTAGYRMAERAAATWLKEHPRSAHAELVSLALQMAKASRRDAGREFIWHGTSDDGSQPLGACAFLVWESPHLLFEAVEHFERDQYDSGEAEEAYARHVVSLDSVTEARLRNLAKQAIAYFDRWALLARLLSFFPIWE